MKQGKAFISFWFCFLVLVVAAGTAGATFVSPGKVKLAFQPNLEQQFVFIVGGTRTGHVNVTLTGSLAQYAEIVDIRDTPPGAGLQGKMITVHLKLPEFIETPGENTVNIRAAEIVPGGTGGIGTAVTIVAPIAVFVPYPGIYVLTTFRVPNVNENETVEPVISASNLGFENISNAWGEIDVFNQRDELLTTIKTETMPLLSNTRSQEYKAQWDSVGYPPGDYFAKARFYYRQNVSHMERPFKIGHLIVHVLNYTRAVKFETINPFEVIVQSGWNEDIPNVYAFVTVNETTFQTPSTTLVPWERQTLQGYFDTSGLDSGTYNAEIVLHYQGYTDRVKGTVEVLPKPKEKLLEQPALIYSGIIALLVLLFALSVFLFFLFKKKKKR